MLKFLVPGFIKQFDKTLVLNYPFWYIVKLHYIAYFTVLMWALSYFVGCILEIDISAYNPEKATGMWTFVFSVLSVILFCVWIYYLTIYNNEDRFGNYSIWDDTKMLFVLIIGINLLMSFSYPMQLRVKSRLAHTFDDATLAKQYNALNLANKYITNNVEDFQYCGYDVHESVDYRTLRFDTNAFENNMPFYDLKKYKNFLCYSPELGEHYNYNISSVLFSTSEKTGSSVFNNTFLTAQQIENQYKKHKTDADILKAITEQFNVAKLYAGKFNNNGTFSIDYIYNSHYTPKDYLDNYNHYEKNCVANFPESYYKISNDGNDMYLPKNDISPYITNIYDAKFKLPYILSNGYLMFAFYFSFFVSLFIIIFRNNRWQHFLISIVAFILCGIIIGILSLAAGSSSSEALFSTLSLLTWVIAGVISLNYYFKKDKYRVVGAVATNLFYVVLPLMPFFFCIYLHEVFGWLKCYQIDEQDVAGSIECEIVRHTFNNVMLYSQIIGILIFIIAVMPFYKVFFAKQKALPKDK